MAFLPTVLRNIDLLSCTIYPGTIAAGTGVITWGTGIDIASASGVSSIDHLMITPSFSTQEVGASDLFDELNINVKRGHSIDIGEIRSSVPYSAGFAAGFSSCLEAVAFGSQVFKVVAVTKALGGSTASLYHAAMGLIRPGQIPVIESGTNARKIVSVTSAAIGYPPYIGATLPGYFA